MLLAVEGSGFFSSSASGYSKGLSLLFFGRAKDEFPIKALPWNHYQLVDDYADSDNQSTSKESRGSSRCTCFNCFSHATSEANGACPPNVNTLNQAANMRTTLAESESASESADHKDENESRVFLKSSLKKTSRKSSQLAGSDDNLRNTPEELKEVVSSCTWGRKLQWVDSCGMELAEIREFEVSEDDFLDEECEQGSFRRCECVIQ